MSFSIIDIRKKDAKQELVRSIIDGLTTNNPKLVPSMILYDNRGLQLYEKVTNTDEYYLTRCEEDILNKDVDQITEFISSGSSIIELGSG